MDARQEEFQFTWTKKTIGKVNQWQVARMYPKLYSLSFCQRKKVLLKKKKKKKAPNLWSCDWRSQKSMVQSYNPIQYIPNTYIYFRSGILYMAHKLSETLVFRNQGPTKIVSLNWKTNQNFTSFICNKLLSFFWILG